MRAETKTLRYLQKTPSYKLTAHDDSIVAQHHYTGHTHAIVYFLASAANPRCRTYCQELGQQAAKARAFKTVIMGIAPEPVAELARLHHELALPFPLLSDPGSAVAERYGLLAKRWLRPAQVEPALIVHDKYGIAYFIAVAENAEERPAWEEIEAVLRRFPRT
ncbi:MAG: redoxin domain-containing protein [Acidobacteria bacterium]|nr:redoxin domain-containing protein [Acidobacteriota bacterium]